MVKLFRSLAKYILGICYYLEYIFLLKLGKDTSQLLSYKVLYFISFFSKKKFMDIKHKIIEADLVKLRNKKILRVGFVTYSGAMWTLDSLYKKMMSDDSFSADIIIARFSMPSAKAMDDTYRETIEYFKNDLKYEIRTSDDGDLDVSSYDILFYCTPFDFSDSFINVRNIKLKSLICYSCYSYMLAEKIEKLDLPIYVLSWKLFCDSKYYKELISRKSRIYTQNAEYCGFPKMDEFYLPMNKEKCEKKLIIFAPHHSLTNDRVKFSTFDHNYKFILDIVDKYKNSTFWIFKPHPLLKAQSIKAGVFKNEKEYEAYLECWNKKTNAKVVENGQYIDWFKQSSAMITDSVSFIAEYQFTGNPLLLLESGYQKYNEFGEQIRNQVYCSSGDSAEEICFFVENVIDDIDPKKEQRDKFFRDELDYYTENGKVATEFMYDEMKNIR